VFGGRFHQHFTCSFYVRRSQSAKNTVKPLVFFALLGSLHVKAGCKMLMKLTPKEREEKRVLVTSFVYIFWGRKTNLVLLLMLMLLLLSGKWKYGLFLNWYLYNYKELLHCMINSYKTFKNCKRELQYT